METISVIEAARLERDGGQRRLELARVALKDFFIEHPNGMHDQRVESQWLALECEVDSANRRYMDCVPVARGGGPIDAQRNLQAQTEITGMESRRINPLVGR